MTTLTPETFDALARDTHAREGRPEKLWGAATIARALGVSTDTVKAWAEDPDVPIYRPKGYYAVRSELERWLKTKPK